MHPIITTLIKRIGLGIVSLFFVTLIIFSSVNMLPGDFVEAVLGQSRTEETVRIFRQELGLDKPYHVRYVNWLTSAIQGDLGSTFSGRNATYANQPQQNTARSVSSLLQPRLFNTFFLAAMTAIIAIPLSYYLYVKDKTILDGVKNSNLPFYNFLLNKWYIDEVYDFIFVKPLKKIGVFFWKKGDQDTIDRFGPDGISKIVNFISNKAVRFQSGYIYDYAFVMLIGLSALITYLILN